MMTLLSTLFEFATSFVGVYRVTEQQISDILEGCVHAEVERWSIDTRESRRAVIRCGNNSPKARESHSRKRLMVQAFNIDP